MNGIEVRQASLEDMDNLSPLFNDYRMFYGRDSDLESARTFLTHRYQRGESIIFLAVSAGNPVGFAQLYPSFSSISLARTYLLNDLFVQKNARRKGVAKALIESAEIYARHTGAIRLTLSTAIDNGTAQATYEATGWRKDNNFFVYHLPIG